MENNKKQTATTPPQEIDLIDLIKQIWLGRWFIIKITAAIVLLGMVVAFTSKVQYSAETRILPEARTTQSSTSQLLRQFGGFPGVSASDGGEAIRPNIYPEVLKATPFFLDLLEKEVFVDNNKISIFEYLSQYETDSGFANKLKKYTVRLPWTLASWFRRGGNDSLAETGNGLRNIENNQIIDLTPSLSRTISSLRGKVSASISERAGIITISVELSDPKVAAQIAQYSVDYLTEYISAYRTEKAQRDLDFVQQRFLEKEKKYLQAQHILSQFRDANRNVQSATVLAEEQRLQHQATLAFNIYNNLAQQLEQARIKVQEETPAFTVLNPVQVPLNRSSPNRMLILTISVFIGTMFGIVFILGRNLFNRFS